MHMYVCVNTVKYVHTYIHNTYVIDACMRMYVDYTYVRRLYIRTYLCKYVCVYSAWLLGIYHWVIYCLVDA